MRPFEHRSILKFIVFGMIVLSAIISVVIYSYRKEIATFIRTTRATKNSTLPEAPRQQAPEMEILNTDGIEIIVPTEVPAAYEVVTPTTVPTIAL